MTKEFSFATVEDFDAHISNSIYGYPQLLPLIIPISRYFVEPDSNVYDLGCSTGTLLKAMADSYDKSVSFIGYDIEPNLLPYGERANVQAFLRDITDPSIQLFNTSFITSIFTLQFIERVKRRVLLQKVYDSLRPGGAFVVAEKIYCENAQVQDIYNFSAYDFKRKSFTDKEILDKQMTLRRIMHPLSDEQNREEFLRAGFKNISQFWRSLNFVAYLCIKN